jgi:tetratricopeptide (TPR) repeat protein
MPEDESPLQPLCFVIMPFGKKPNPTGGTIDFDAVYESVIKPAIEQAHMDPIRADEEELGGIIHKPMFERLILCDYAIADLTTANANVFYELGVRHGIRPQTTVSIFAEGTRLPFDVEFLRCLPYALEAGVPARAAADVEMIATALSGARQDAPDSPVFQLVNDMPAPDVSHLKTDVFRDRAAYAEETKRRLAAARREGEGAVDALRVEVGPIEDAEAGVVVDLLLSYRAVEAWDAMIELFAAMSDPVKRSVLVREQLAFALNRSGDGEAAEEVLQTLIDETGPSSETYGILGRVYKDRWEQDRKAGHSIEAQGHLSKAIAAYRRGFESDWRDAYPGINAVTLMELSEPPDEQRLELLPVVLYSTMRRIASGHPNYWDYATLLELEVLRSNQEAAVERAGEALAFAVEVFQPKTTARNLRLIREAREQRGEDTAWLDQILEAFDRKGEELQPPQEEPDEAQTPTSDTEPDTTPSG